MTRSEKIKNYAEALFLFGVGLTIIVFWINLYWPFFPSNYTEDTSFSYEGCNVAGVIMQGPVETYNPDTSGLGDIIASSEEIIFSIDIAEAENDVKAILLEVNSFGGIPAAAHEIEDALRRTNKPTVVHIREAGLSAAYLAATGGDIIFASELSDVGSIGVTQSYVDESKLNEKEGYTYNQLSTGKFKDILDPDKPLTWEERQLLERDLQVVHEAFVKTVAENRSLDIDTVKELADGSSMLGTMALENGLIDRIGGFYEVEDYLAGLIGEEPIICW